MKSSEISSVLNTLCALILITLLLTHNNYLLDNHIWLYRVCTVYKGVVQSRYLYLLSAPNIHICNHIYCKPKVSEDYFFFFFDYASGNACKHWGGEPRGRTASTVVLVCEFWLWPLLNLNYITQVHNWSQLEMNMGLFCFF